MEEYKLVLGRYPDGEFNRVHAILLTDDGRVLLRYKNGEPRVTGGRIDEDDVNLEATLRREVLEEINCEIDRCDYLGYLEVDCKDVSDMYWARMVARVSKIGDPKSDPDREGSWIYGRTLAPRKIAEEELSGVEAFGKNNLLVLDAAYKVAQESGYFSRPLNDEYEVLNVEEYLD